MTKSHSEKPVLTPREAAKIASRMVNKTDRLLYDVETDEFVPNPFYRST